MAHVKVDRVQQTTQSTGTGALVLDPAAIPRMFRFQDKMANGSDFWGLIEHQTANEVEISLCTYNAGTITRSFATGSSSSTGGLVPFSVGAKTISVVAPASATPIVNGEGDMSVARDVAVGRNLSVAGAAAITGNLGVGGNASVRGHFQQTVNGEAELRMHNPSTGSVAASIISAVGGSANSSLRLGVFENSGTPLAKIETGSAVAKLVYSAAIHDFFTGGESRWAIFPHFQPTLDNVYNVGSGSFRVANYFGAAGIVNTSDRNDKVNWRTLNPAEIRVGRRLAQLVHVWQSKDAVALKGEDNARWHSGFIAQDVADAFIAEGLDPFRHGCVGFDELDKRETYSEVVTREKKRTVTENLKVVEIVDGQPVRVTRPIDRVEIVGTWETVSENGQTVMVDSGELSRVTGEPVMVALKHFVPEMEEVTEPRTRTVPDLDENGERKIRLNVRPDQLHAFVIAGLNARLAEMEA
jgi:hypothetical protein